MEVPDLSPNELKLDLILADYAAVAEGKMNLLGGGWSYWNGPLVGPSAVAIIAKVPSSWTGEQVEIEIALYDEDGQLVTHAPQMKGVLNIGPAARPGDPTDFLMAQNMGQFPLVPNRSYTWRVTVNGDTSPEWWVSFFVKPTEQGAQGLRSAS